jgi:hypothetical protein
MSLFWRSDLHWRRPCHRDSSQNEDETTRLAPTPNSRVGFRSVVKKRCAASAFAAQRSSQRATRKSAHAANRRRAAASTGLAPKRWSNDLLKFLRAFILPSCQFGGGMALRRELHSCFADQPRFELKIRTPCHHGHARPTGQPNKRPDAGGSLCDVRACVTHDGPQEYGQCHPRMI